MVSLYEMTVPVLTHKLNVLSKILAKGSALAQDTGNELTEEKIVESRLVADMETFAYQVQRASDASKSLIMRLAKREVPKWADDEKTVEELQARIRRTIDLLATVKEEEFNGREEDEIFIQTGSPVWGDLKFTGKSYVLEFVLPNFFFHIVTAYAILRKEGVEIGKKDYLK